MEFSNTNLLLSHNTAKIYDVLLLLAMQSVKRNESQSKALKHKKEEMIKRTKRKKNNYSLIR